MPRPYVPVCYVVPHLDESSQEHYAHIPFLLRQVTHYGPVAVLAERVSGRVDLPGIKTVISLDNASSHIGRILRLVQALRVLRELGYSRMFLRYSRLTATALIILRPFTGVQIYYWTSNQPDRIPSVDRSFSQRWKARWVHWHSRWLLQNVDYVVTGPESMVDYVADYWRLDRERIKLLYNDVDTKRFEPLPPGHRMSEGTEERFVILFVHRLSPRKGSRLLIPLAEALERRIGATFRLLVVGTGPDHGYVEAARQDSSVRDLVSLRGSVPNKDLPALYREADCFLMPSFEEGFPRVILEAMSSATPVVATEAGGTQDILGDSYPYIYRVGDINGMADGLTDIASMDFEARLELGDSLRARTQQRFDTALVARMFADEIMT